MVLFNGDNNSELIVGSNDDDTIRGAGGDDTILGGGGADSLLGNRGADLIEGGEGVDTLRGGRGNDTLIGNTEGDLIRGGKGDDLLVWNNGDGSDTMRGGRGLDTVQVNGAFDAGDDFELRASGHRAEFERLNLGNFTLDVDNVEQFEINGGGGDDTLNVRDLTGTDVQQVYFNGGDGNDSLDATEANVAVTAYGDGGNDLLKGSSVPEITDTLDGGDGNDTIIGNKGDDLKIGGYGDDRLIWNNGDGSDIMEGDEGYDVTEVNGAVDAGDDFELRANGHRTEFERLNLGNFTLDVDNVEQFEINGGGGDDTLNVRDLTGTDVQKVYFNGGEGNDTFDATEANVAVAAYGDGGNDLLKGSNVPEITDTLDGGIGNDTIIGNQGADLKIGGDGDDRLIWNNGDGSDTMEGGNDFDVVEVNGAVDAGDNFELRANGERAEFERLNLGNFVLDVDDVEQFEINGLGGDDTLTVQDLTGTDVQQVIFNGADGDDLLDASLSNVSVIANGGAGEDTLLGGSADDTLIGGNGNNIYTGGAGADVFVVSFDGIDVINDFNRGEGDVLEISRSEFGISSIDDLTYDNATGILSAQDTQIATISNDAISPISSDPNSSLVLDSSPIFVPGEDLQLV